MPQSTPDGKWVIWERSTGRRIESWPVDARGMLASGWATDVDPAGEPVADVSALELVPVVIPGIEAERKTRAGTLTLMDTVPDVAAQASDSVLAPAEIPAKRGPGRPRKTVAG